MIQYPYKRIFGLVGAPRSGKDTVAKYLQESRGFLPMAFADKIKEEFGISKDDFEKAKVDGNIDDLRKKLWDFSAKKKSEDPTYFIRTVMEDALNSYEPVVITDIRTVEELNAFYEHGDPDCMRKLYRIVDQAIDNIDINGFIPESKIKDSQITELLDAGKLEYIINNSNLGVYKFIKNLDKLFFEEDIVSLAKVNQIALNLNNTQWRHMFHDYINQFGVMVK